MLRAYRQRGSGLGGKESVRTSSLCTGTVTEGLKQSDRRPVAGSAPAHRRDLTGAGEPLSSPTATTSTSQTHPTPAPRGTPDVGSAHDDVQRRLVRRGRTPTKGSPAASRTPRQLAILRVLGADLSRLAPTAGIAFIWHAHLSKVDSLRCRSRGGQRAQNVTARPRGGRGVRPQDFGPLRLPKTMAGSAEASTTRRLVISCTRSGGRRRRCRLVSSQLFPRTLTTSGPGERPRHCARPPRRCRCLASTENCSGEQTRNAATFHSASDDLTVWCGARSDATTVRSADLGSFRARYRLTRE